VSQVEKFGLLTERFVGPHALTDLAKHNRHSALLRQTYAIGSDFVVTIDGLGFVNEMPRISSERDFSIKLEPVFLTVRNNLAHGFADRIRNSCLLLIRFIHLDEPPVDGLVVRIKQDLDDAELLLHRVEEVAIEHFTLAQSLLRFGRLTLPVIGPGTSGQGAKLVLCESMML
jgi:hypothetical protein